MKSMRTLVLLVTCLTASASALRAQSPPPSGRPSAAKAHDAAATLPPVVLSAFRHAYPTAVIAHVQKEREHGRTVWEVESLDAGLGRDILYDPSGSVIELEEQILVAQLPAPVAAAVARTYPTASITKAEKVMREQTIVYELSVKGPAGRTVQVTPDGALVTPSPPVRHE
jgi:hypothetical protein